jgi:hypothetical protein
MCGLSPPSVLAIRGRSVLALRLLAALPVGQLAATPPAQLPALRRPALLGAQPQKRRLRAVRLANAAPRTRIIHAQ